MPQSFYNGFRVLSFFQLKHQSAPVRLGFVNEKFAFHTVILIVETLHPYRVLFFYVGQSLKLKIVDEYMVSLDLGPISETFDFQLILL